MLDSTRTGYFWTYISPGGPGYTFYDYRDSRSRDGPAEILKDFRGYLQTDAYVAYESGGLDSAGSFWSAAGPTRAASSSTLGSTNRASPITCWDKLRCCTTSRMRCACKVRTRD
jgi:hypothetical protein